ncbi:MAG: M23 family metallopeptidase, partial [Verrucomicrobiales bacterium]|nr:M23 family metallopeptidase [Verrucomicrobiales bacterium]
ALGIFTLEASAGDSLTVAVGENSGNWDFEPEVTLYGPNGVRLGTDWGLAGASVTARTSLTGNHFAVIQSYDADGGGSYWFRVDGATPPTLNSADGFDYPFGNRGWRDGSAHRVIEFPNSDLPLMNQYYPHTGVDYTIIFGGRELDEEPPDWTDWYNMQDVGAYYATAGGLHSGEDWNLAGGNDADLGQLVFAVAQGEVVKIRSVDATEGSSGWVIVLKHEYPEAGGRTYLYSLYVHIAPAYINATLETPNLSGAVLSSNDFGLTEGDWVQRGEVIGRIARTTKYSPHLHFEIRCIEPALLSGGRIWPKSVGAYYTQDGQKHTNGMSSGDVLAAFVTMSNEVGLLDPSDFIAAHRPSVPVTYRNGDKVEATESGIYLRPKAGASDWIEKTHLGMQGTVVDASRPSAAVNGVRHRWYEVDWKSEDGKPSFRGWIAADYLARTSPPPPNRLQVSQSSAGGGSVITEPARSSYAAGERVMLRAVPAEGYYLDGWSGVDSYDGLLAWVTMNGFRSVTPVFKRLFGADGFNCPADFAALAGFPRRLAARGDDIDLALLRRFRDEVLTATPAGQELVQGFYDNSTELLDHMANDPAVMESIQDALAVLQPTIRDVVDGAGGQSFDEGQAEAVAVAAEEILQPAGMVLRATTQKVLERVGPLDELAGKTGTEIRQQVVGTFVRIVRPEILTDGTFQFRVIGDVSRALSIESSRDLSHWVPLDINPITQLPVTVQLGPLPAATHEFYRIVAE